FNSFKAPPDASGGAFVFGRAHPRALGLKAWPSLRVRCSGALAETNFTDEQSPWIHRAGTISLRLRERQCVTDLRSKKRLANSSELYQESSGAMLAGDWMRCKSISPVT